MIRWIFFIVFVLLVEYYAFQSVRTLTKNRIFYIIYWLVSLAFLVNLGYNLLVFNRSTEMSHNLMLAFGLFILTFAPKLIALLVLFSEDIFRFTKGVINYFSSTNTEIFLPDRRDFVSKIALGLAAIPFASILYGLTRGKYNFKVIQHTLFFEDLPDSFDGFKLTHISDIHSGSFDDVEKISYGIDLINEQKSDVILFTGDIVNNRADEMDEWIPYFKKLKAKEGKYSVLGNHDYGLYALWENKEEERANFEGIKAVHPKIGFNLLLNESVYLNRGEDKIAIIGVENWGTRFIKKGDLHKATSKIQQEDFKILMSHDPSHWDAEVKKNEVNYNLTLSGHTHGMQFGIEIPGIKWSPVQYIYKQWAGIYEHVGKYINVNRGFGFLAFPGRIGIWPEITVITLKKKR